MVWPITEPAKSWSSLLKARPWTPWNHEPATRNCCSYSLAGGAGGAAAGVGACWARAPPITADASASEVKNRPHFISFPPSAARTLDREQRDCHPDATGRGTFNAAGKVPRAFGLGMTATAYRLTSAVEGKCAFRRRETMAGPLSGLTIVELAGIGPGPMCSMMLGDMGADVIRVDRTKAHVMDRLADPKFAVHNRSRRSVSVDLQKKEGVEVVLRL